MIGAQFFNDSGLVQITDELESMVFLREVPISTALPRDTNQLRVLRDDRAFIFGPISQASIPNSGVGLELFNAAGRKMFSSLVPPAAIIGMVKTDYRNPNKEVRGAAGRKYGVCVLNQGVASWATNIQTIPGGPPDYDDYYLYNRRERYIDYEITDWGIRTKIAEYTISGYEDAYYPSDFPSNLAFDALVFDLTAVV